MVSCPPPRNPAELYSGLIIDRVRDGVRMPPQLLTPVLPAACILGNALLMFSWDI